MDYYQILGLSHSASLKDIKLAYRKLAKKYHPDQNLENPEAEEKFKLITEAYNILSNSFKKAIYDFTDTEGHHLHPWVNTYTYKGHPNAPYTAGKNGQKRKVNPFIFKGKKVYSRKTKVLAGFSVAAIVFLIGLVVYTLLNFSSNYYLNAGLRQYHAKQYSSALLNLEQSLQLFDSDNSEAYFIAAKILINQFQDFEKATHYLDKALSLTKDNTKRAELHYLKGKCLKSQNKYRSAYTNFKLASVMDLPIDSLHYELAELNCFVFKNYEDAIKNFNNLILINPAFADAYLGRAYSYQQLQEHQKAISDFKQYIKLNDTEGTAFYMKAVSEIALNHPQTACDDLNTALNLGMTGASRLIAKHCK